jgi:hypothetical protein
MRSLAESERESKSVGFYEGEVKRVEDVNYGNIFRVFMRPFRGQVQQI